MNIEMFEKPDKHPYGILDKYEDENVLAIILHKCIEAGNLDPVQMNYSYPKMVTDGLLTEHGERMYKLTSRSLGLLYSVYAKEDTLQ